MHAFSRSLPYRIWALLGPPLIIATAFLGSASADPASQAPIAAAAAAAAVWVAGLFAFTLRLVGADQRREVEALGAPAPAGAVPQAHELMRSLALEDVGDLQDATADMHRFQRRWIACFAAFLGGLFVAIGAHLAGAGTGVLLLPVAAVLVAAALVPKTVGRAWALSDAQLAPLGLEVTALPSLVARPEAGGDSFRLAGATSAVGRRHGRRVRLTVGIAASEVHVDAPGAPLALTGTSDHLRADAGDADELLAALGRDPRWDGVEVTVGADGVVVRRPGGARALPLLDLWLAERVAGLGR